MSAAVEVASVIDVDATSAALDSWKALLITQIRAEQERNARWLAEGQRTQMLVTVGMGRALLGLHRYGQRSAKDEIRSLGYRPRSGVQAFAAGDELDPATIPPRLVPPVQRLQERLDRLGEGMVARGRELEAGNFTRDAITSFDEELARVPGVLDAASQVVSQAYTSGLADIYEANQEVFSWRYTAALDGGTCSSCAPHAGEVYDSLAAAYAVLPEFGPNPLCQGGYRCRCRLEPIPRLDPGIDDGTLPPELDDPFLQTDFGQAMMRGESDLKFSSTNDPFLDALARGNGFDGKPTVVADSAFDKLAANPRRQELWRGIDGSDGDFAEQFRTGNYFAGRGKQGSGTYSSIDPGETFEYAGDTPQVIRMLLSKDARVVDYEDVAEQMEAAREKVQALRAAGKLSQNQADRMLNGHLIDEGRYAASRGWDAMVARGTDHSDHYIVLNRSKVTVSKKTRTPGEVVRKLNLEGYDEYLDDVVEEVAAAGARVTGMAAEKAFRKLDKSIKKSTTWATDEAEQLRYLDLEVEDTISRYGAGKPEWMKSIESTDDWIVHQIVTTPTNAMTQQALWAEKFPALDLKVTDAHMRQARALQTRWDIAKFNDWWTP